jgi:phage-related protein
VKSIVFLGDSLSQLRAFPDDARAQAGFQLRLVQSGADPTDWKPMASVAPGVREIRVRVSAGAYRVIYLATLPEAVLVLHAFEKRTQKTPQRHMDLARERLRAWKG